MFAVLDLDLLVLDDLPPHDLARGADALLTMLARRSVPVRLAAAGAMQLRRLRSEPALAALQRGMPVIENATEATAWADALGTGAMPAAQTVCVSGDPDMLRAAMRAGVVGVGIGREADAEAVHRAGGRLRLPTLSALAGDLEAVLEAIFPHPVPLTTKRLEALMDEALSEARRGMEAGEVPIGAVVAQADGTVRARGHNERRATGSRLAHAEMQAMRSLEREGADTDAPLLLVTTLEPCTMCLGAILNAGFETVIYALEAPSNGGVQRCEPYAPSMGAWPRLVPGIRRAESRDLLATWAADRPQAAFVQDLLAKTAGGETPQ